MTDLNKFLPGLEGVHSLSYQLKEPFLDLAARFADEPGTVVLPSGTDMDCAGYNILGIWPWLGLKAWGGRLEVMVGDQTRIINSHPLDFLDFLMNLYSLGGRNFAEPLGAGLLGYLGYDLKDGIENLPRTVLEQDLPDLCLFAPSLILIQERRSGKARIFLPLLNNTGEDSSSRELCTATLDAFFSRIRSPSQKPGGFDVGSDGLTSNFTRSEYMEAVEKIIAYIRAGDIYQVNLSQRFQTRFTGDTFTLFRKMFEMNPAPFFGFVQAGDHQILSTSPERFVKREGDHLETRPIKGTIQRGRDEAEDLKLAKELSASFKDDAELSMIVDLMRNDLGRVARGGTVRVEEHKRLEAYDNVYHLVSIVKARLKPGASSVDILRAAFPGGSITGCPKIRSMEIIDELEPVSRHVYTGSLGYLGFNDTMDLSIAIRTATVAGGRLSFSVGGGIVYDSQPALEFQETLHKGKTLMDALGAAREKIESPLKAWVNGRLMDQGRASVPLLSPGFQYGAGIFETIRTENGSPLFLKEHLSRLTKSWETLFDSSLPRVCWPDVISQLLKANGLDRGVAAVKITAALSSSDDVPLVGVTARLYVHRLALFQRDGINLITYPFPRHTPMADHKSLNYLYYDRAGRFARSQGGDEALILNPGGTISETNTCSIMAVSGRKILLPQSSHSLPGVTRAALEGELERRGYEVHHKKVTVEEFLDFGSVVLANSLMGLVPALSLDGKRLTGGRTFCREMNFFLGFKAEMPRFNG